MNILTAKFVKMNKRRSLSVHRFHFVTQEMHESERGMPAATPRLERSNGGCRAGKKEEIQLQSIVLEGKAGLSTQAVNSILELKWMFCRRP